MKNLHQISAGRDLRLFIALRYLSRYGTKYMVKLDEETDTIFYRSDHYPVWLPIRWNETDWIFVRKEVGM